MSEDRFIGSRRRTTRFASKDEKGGRKTYVESDSSSNEAEGEPSPVKEKPSPEKKKKKRKRLTSSENPRRRMKILSSGDSESEEKTSSEENYDSASSDVVKKAKVRKFKKTKKKKRDKNKGRRDIKKILDDKDLQEQTREAAKEERERLQRLKEREKSDDENDEIQDGAETKSQGPVVLQKNPHVEVSSYLAQNLRPHQIEGVRFIFNNLIESTERTKRDPGGGCILAHCMGLGKTLQTIASVHTFLKSKHLPFKRALIVAPLNTVRNWIAEFVQWCEDGDELNLYNFAEPKSNKARVETLKLWSNKGGVLILGYDMYRIMTTKIRYKMWQETVHETLVDPGPDIVICDEGHMLKNSNSHISRQINKIKTKRRLVLTGTPLQNNLIEYHCMVNFVKPDLLGSSKEFRNRFVNPILNGQHIDSTEYDVKIMKKRSHVLHQMLEGFVQRKDYTALKPYLSSKFEYVLKVRLTPLQIKLYQHYLDTMTNRGSNNMVLNSYGKGASLFSDYQNLMRVWTHPKSLLLHTVKKEKLLARQADYELIEEEVEEESASESDEWRSSSGDEDPESAEKGKNDKDRAPKRKVTRVKQKKEIIELDSTDSDEITSPRKLKSQRRKASIKMSSSEEESRKDTDCDDDDSSEYESDDVSDADSEGAEKIPHRRTRSKAVKENKRYRLRCEESSSENEEQITLEEVSSESKEPEWYTQILPEDRKILENYQNSSKIVILFEILKLAEERNEKVLVFSQSLISLDLIEEMLEYAPAPCRVNHSDDDVNLDQLQSQGRRRWYKNIDYFRMDGATQGHHRQRWINAFNDENDRRSRLFLISTRAGSLGVNLIGANRVVIFDASWNPSHDTQSMFRVYRFGQTKKCYIYRLIAEGTMEEKIYQRQVNKQSLAFRVVDEQQINRHFTASSLAEMYTFNPTTPDATKDEPTPIVPKDGVLAEILSDPRTRPMIASYHEHDSLLDHQVDEELTEEERKAAWEEYEMLKTRGYVPSPAVPDARQRQLLPNKNTFMLPASSTLSPNVDDTTMILTRLSKMVANAFYQYQICEVKSVEEIVRHLRETPLYSNSNKDTLKAIAVEVNFRLELQRNDKFNTFKNLQHQFKGLQAEYFKLVGGNISQNISQSGKHKPPPIPSKSALLEQLASTSGGFPKTSAVLNGDASPIPQTSVTTVSEVIVLSDDEKEGTSDTVDK